MIYLYSFRTIVQVFTFILTQFDERYRSKYIVMQKIVHADRKKTSTSVLNNKILFLKVKIKHWLFLMNTRLENIKYLSISYAANDQCFKH